jgi:hypothetical protein
MDNSLFVAVTMPNLETGRKINVLDTFIGDAGVTIKKYTPEHYLALKRIGETGEK